MKIIAITQRVDRIEAYQETRDCLDERWYDFLDVCGCIPLIIPNHMEAAKKLIQEVKIDGILLTGGNSLCSYGGDAPCRDQVETYLMEQAISRDIPLLGVCRGMQVIQDYFHIPLEKVEGHVAVRHPVYMNGIEVEKNSYHTLASKALHEPFHVIARSVDGCIEAIQHKEYRIVGMMWHPERNEVFSKDDIDRVKELYGKGENK